MMPGLTVREFACSLCQLRFTMLSGDLMLPGPNICDDCLRDVWELTDEALMQYAARRLGTPSEDKTLVNSVVQHIKWHREQWETAEDVIRHRDQERRILE